MSSFNSLIAAGAPSQQKRQMFLVASVVVALHVGLLVFGKFWNPTAHVAKTEAKMVVQTIQLHPLTRTQVETEPFHIPLEIKAPQETMPSAEPKEEKQEELPIEAKPMETPFSEESKKEVNKKEDITIPVDVIPQPILESPPPSPISKPMVEQAPKAPPKPTTSEPKKTAVSKKAALPVKKETDTVKKKAVMEKPKAKKANEAEVKRQKEKEEADKKRQQEKVKEEKKRQQEIAAAQEAVRQKEKALLSKAKETLAKMGETRDKITSTSSSINLEATTLPKILGSLQVDALPFGEASVGGSWGAKEISYSGEVASRLKAALRLPDYGAVKIKLTLERTGKVVKVETVQTESTKNKAYLESKIPSLLFPSFGQRFQGVTENTFMITLQND